MLPRLGLFEYPKKKNFEIDGGEVYGIDIFLISQILAAISFGFGIASYQFEGRRAILLFLVACNVFNATHFYLLGRPGPTSMLLVTGLRYSVATMSTDRRLMVLFMAATIGVYLGYSANILSILSCVGTLIATYGSFQADSCRLRLFVMVGNAMWVLHNFLSSTPVGAVMELSFLTSNLVGYWRHCRRRSVEPDEVEPRN